MKLGIVPTIFLIFLILKLTGNLGWSWWWVTSPLWIFAAIMFTLFAVVGVFTMLKER